MGLTHHPGSPAAATRLDASASGSASPYAVNGVSPARHLVPASAEAVAAIVREANEGGEAVIPFGGRTALEAGNPPRRYDVALDLTALDGVVEHEPGDLTATVRAGARLAWLATQLAAHGQMWPPAEVSRPALATVGGVLAGAAAGPSRLRYAHPRDWVLGVRAVLGDGTLTRAGGKVVKNVSGYDLTRFYAGSYGSLCVIVEASLKLWPLAESERVIVARFADLREAGQALAALRADHVELDAAVSLDRAAARYIGEDAALAVVRLRGAAAVVERLADRVARALAAGRPEPAGTAFLAVVVDVPQRATVTLRVVAPESRMAQALADVGEGVLRYDGTGLAFLVRERADAAWLHACRARAETLEGSAILERAPATLRTEVDTWGSCAIPLDLARRIKSALDPRGTLSPGRFAGGL